MLLSVTTRERKIEATTGWERDIDSVVDEYNVTYIFQRVISTKNEMTEAKRYTKIV